MASQQRVYDMVKRLSKDHIVDVITLINNETQLQLSNDKLKDACNKYYPIKAINYGDMYIKKKLIGLIFLVAYYLLGYSSRYFYWGNKWTIKKIKEIISQNHYDIVQIEYWYLYKIFKELMPDCVKVLDTHGLMYQKKSLGLKKQYRGNIPYFEQRELAKYELSEKEAVNLSDLVIAISRQDEEYLRELFHQKDFIKIYTGQELEYFINYPIKPENRTILFYGGMGSPQNISAFFRLYNEILPSVRSTLPDVKCIVVGSNPPEAIKKLHDGENLIVTGFVEDVREFISKTTVMALPLDLGAGFRSRVVEVMAMSIPVVGTHNALDSIEMTSGLHGFITDDNEMMADFLVTLLTDKDLRSSMAENCRKFVAEKFSIEATFGNLSYYYSRL